MVFLDSCKTKFCAEYTNRPTNIKQSGFIAFRISYSRRIQSPIKKYRDLDS
jgi:hypothetical protein